MGAQQKLSPKLCKQVDLVVDRVFCVPRGHYNHIYNFHSKYAVLLERGVCKSGCARPAPWQSDLEPVWLPCLGPSASSARGGGGGGGGSERCIREVERLAGGRVESVDFSWGLRKYIANIIVFCLSIMRSLYEAF